MTRLTSLALLVAAAAAARAQQFTALDNALTEVYFPAVAFADVDGDGALDLLTCGSRQTDGTRVSALYRGDGRGGFTLLDSAAFAKTNEGSVAFGDVDGDGDVDLLQVGAVSQTEWVTKLYRNGGSGDFAEDLGAPFLEDVDGGEAAFSDVDGDGDLDVIVAGSRRGPNNRGSLVYLNDGTGAFAPYAEAPFAEPFAARIGLADLDGDRDEDLVIGGTTWPQAAAVYRNDGRGRFTPYPQVGYSGVSFSAVALGDLDGDGDNDALFTGSDGATSERMTRMYLNDGAADFTPAFPQPFPDLHLGGIAVFDADNDGDNDVLLTGLGGPDPDVGAPLTVLYLGDGVGGFAEAPRQPFADAYLSTVEVADVDGDGDEDVFVAGYVDGETRVTRVYRNDAPVSSLTEGASAARALVYPNPVTAGEALTVVFPVAGGRWSEVFFEDIAGRRHRRPVVLSGGAATASVSTAGLPAGVYVLRVRGTHARGAQARVVIR